MSKYSHIVNSPAPQTEQLTADQVKNNQGGYVYQVDKWMLLRRFLILGSESGTYYVKARKLTQDNAKNVIECIKEDANRVLTLLNEISVNGIAPKNDAAIYVLALVMTYGEKGTARANAYQCLPRIIRTGTHLFQFVEDVNELRGLSRGLRAAVANWYLAKKHDDLEYQLLKYKQRNGWSHRDVLRLCHAKANKSDNKNALLRWAAKGEIPLNYDSDRFHAATIWPEGEVAQKEQAFLRIIKHGLTREMLPTHTLNSDVVWGALLEKMPMHATLRNLAKMTSVGLLKSNLDPYTKIVYERLTNAEHIKKSRLHPISILNALRVYSSGKGDKGKLTWKPVEAIVDALNKAFYLSFDNVQPTKKRIMIGLDVSASMDGNMIAGTGLDARMASVALSTVTANVEPFVDLRLFSTQLVKGEIPKGARLEALIRGAQNLPFGGTDCSLPIMTALKEQLPVDAFIIYTDSETAHGPIHPSQALKEYRRKMGINAKLIVVGMCSNGFSIADPNDAGMIDVVGLDTTVPSLINEFIMQD